MKRKRAIVTSRAAAARVPKRVLRASATPRTSALARDRPAPRPRAPDPEPEPERERPTSVDLTVDLAPHRDGALRLRNPLLIASGVAGYGVEAAETMHLERLGAFCTRGITPRARPGNAPPRAIETPGGLLNGVGLPNPGVETVLARQADRWGDWDVPVIVNVGGASASEFAGVAAALDGQPGVAAIELNLSCANVGDRGRAFAIDADAAEAVMEAVRRATDLPVIAKLSAAAADIGEVAEAVADAGADAICAINTLPGLAIGRDADGFRTGPWLGSGTGGLSGPALKPVALRAVALVSRAVRLPIIGCGGVTNLDDVLDLLAAGASAVAVGTATFADPELPARLVDELEAWCLDHGIGRVAELTGTAVGKGKGRTRMGETEYRT